MRTDINQQYRTLRPQLLMCMIIGYAAFYLTRKSVNYVLPALQTDLGLDKGDIGLLGSLFYLTYGLSKFTAGLWHDSHGQRWFMGVGLFATGLLNVVFAFGESLTLLLAVWALNGFFQGWGWPPCARLLTHWYSRNERGFWWGCWNMSINIGGAIIPLISAFAAHWWGWQAAMLAPGIISMALGIWLIDYQAASTLGAFLLLFSLLVFCIQYMWIGKRSYVTVSGKSYRGDVQPLPVTLVWSVIAILAVWIAFNALLYGSIFYGSFTVNWGVDYTLTLDNFIKLFGQGMSDGAWPSLLDTLLYAGIAAPITAAFGLLIAWIVVRQQFKGKKTIEFTTMLCFAVPGTVAGVSYILAFNSAPVYLTGTAAIVIISMVMRNVPVGIRAGIAGLGQIDKSLDEASLSLRAGSLRTITHILLPLLRPAILSALIYSFVRAITTVSAIVFLVTPDTRVATAYILNRVEDGEYGVAIAYGSILIVVMLAIIFIFDWLIGEARISRSKAKNQA